MAEEPRMISVVMGWICLRDRITATSRIPRLVVAQHVARVISSNPRSELPRLR